MPVTPALPPAIPGDLIMRLSVDQYHKMIDAGILGEDDPVELIEGWLVARMSKNPPHRFSVRALYEALETLLPEGWHLDRQEPITLETSEPEPDVFVARGTSKSYRKRHPGPGDLVLLVEVSEGTLKRDRGLKKRAYARAKIPIYWIVNLAAAQVEVYSDPTGPASRPDYRSRQDYGPTDKIPVVLDGQVIGRIRVAEILP